MAVPQRDPFEHDLAQLLAARRRGYGDRLRQGEEPGSVRVEVGDPIVILGKPCQDRPHLVPLRLVGLVGDVAPRVLLLELLETGGEPSPLPTDVGDIGRLQSPAQLRSGLGHKVSGQSAARDDFENRLLERLGGSGSNRTAVA